MKNSQYPTPEIVRHGSFSDEDKQRINLCRNDHNRLGFAYQMAFVRLTGSFPMQNPFEILEDLIAVVCEETKIDSELIVDYARRQATVYEHQEQIRQFLKLRSFDELEENLLVKFLSNEACRIEQKSTLLAKTRQFLRENHILLPAESTLKRIIGHEADQIRDGMFQRVVNGLSSEVQNNLDQLLEVKEERTSHLQILKNPPGDASPKSLLKLAQKLDLIIKTKVLEVDLGWINNNFQKCLEKKARQYTAHRLRDLQHQHRYTALLCFLQQTYRDTIDQIVDMYNKIITGTYRRAQNQLDKELKKDKKNLQTKLKIFSTMGWALLDENLDDIEIRKKIFNEVSKDQLQRHLLESEEWISGNKSHPFPLVIKRFSYLRQFAPTLLEHISFGIEPDGCTKTDSLLKAIEILKNMNATGKRIVPEDAPVDFIPSRVRSFIHKGEEIDRKAYECGVLTSVKEEIKRGNIWVVDSKRFAPLENYFMPEEEWKKVRLDFFHRARLPAKPEEVASYLTNKLNTAFDKFLKTLSENSFVHIESDGWSLSSDPAEKLEAEEEQKLHRLTNWLDKRIRTITLPELLIEVDNELKFSRFFMPPSKQNERSAESVCVIIATLMAYGCNIGPYTMSRLTQGISYESIKKISDWFLHDDSLRSALVEVVNAIAKLDTVQVWGEGKTSSSDGQRFLFPQKVLQRTYSPKFGDYALEFYTFIADNYAPYNSFPIECTNRDSSFVLDGLLYHETDLEIEEHYVDTHGYTELNFAAFAMLGKRFCPRIKRLHRQWIYKINPEKDYGALSALVGHKDRTIHLDWICSQWDRMGQFFASFESGHVTASVALKRLISYSGKNRFYRAVQEFGRVFKTEFILEYLCNPLLRRRVQRGLLKGEQLHSLARDVYYGKRGATKARDFQQQANSASCLNLILACIVYWQAKEITRILQENVPEEEGIDPSLLAHVSPIAWDNVLIYGKYILNQKLVK